MNRNEITLQEMFSSVIRELREGGRWGPAHIYQSAQAEPDRTEEIRKLPQAEELQLEHRIHLHQDGTLSVSSGSGQKVHTVCTQTV